MKTHAMYKKTIAALVAGGLLGFGGHTAQADSILFPYLNTDAGVFSFVTIVNDGRGEFATVSGYRFTYGHKPNPVNNKRGCNQMDGITQTTPADMLTFEVNGKLNEPGGALFEGGAASPVTSTAFQLPVANQTAFLVVEPLGNTLAAENRNMIQLFGWAEIIDTNRNMMFAYSTKDFGVNDSTNPNFAASYVGSYYSTISWQPASMVRTSWHVLPVGRRSTMLSTVGGGLRAGVTAGYYGSGIVFDRDEQASSGTRLAPIHCFGTITRNDVLQPVTRLTTDNGGWTFLSPASFTLAATDPYDPNGVYSNLPVVTHRIQLTSTAYGVGTHTSMNREPALDNLYSVSLDPGP